MSISTRAQKLCQRDHQKIQATNARGSVSMLVLHRVVTCCVPAVLGLWRSCEWFSNIQLKHVKQDGNDPRSTGSFSVAVSSCPTPFHLPSEGKKTQRIERLRDAMGGAAFSEMVDQQLWTRRNRSVPTGNSWAETHQWWQTSAGRVYWFPPPSPDRKLVADVFLQSRPFWGQIGRQPVQRTLEVSKSLVPLLALKVTDWLGERQEAAAAAGFPGLNFRCFVTGGVNFREDGERVPSVHISCKPDSSDELVLLLGRLAASC